MNEKDLIIAIAISDKWTDIHEEDGSMLEGVYKGMLIGKHPDLKDCFLLIPHYTVNANAISSAARRMPITKRGYYAPFLRQIVMRDHTEDMKDLDSGIVIDLFFYEALQIQKCEAYAKAMGIWVEDETKGAS